jgi:hypothetical protein
MSGVEACRECGRLYGFLPRGVCVDCQDLREQRFQAVKEYLADNRGASILQTATETGVEEGLIVGWVREGRLQYAGPDAGQLEGIDHDEDVKARIRAQLAAQAGAPGTDPHGPAAAPSAAHLGMRSRTP